MAARKTKQAIAADVIEDTTSSEVIVEETVIETPVVEKKRAAKPKHDADELIACRSVTYGKLILIGPKTNMFYSWANEGDVREVEYQDLISLKATRSKYLFKPLFVIEDEDIVEEWKNDLDKIYSKVNQIDIRAMFELPQRQFVTQLNKLPDSIKDTVKNTAYSMLQDGSLYDLRKIKSIDEILGTELTLMIK